MLQLRQEAQELGNRRKNTKNKLSPSSLTPKVVIYCISENVLIWGFQFYKSSRREKMNNFKKKSIMEESMDSVRTFNSDRSATFTLSAFNSRRDSNRNSMDDPDYGIRKERSRSIGEGKMARENSLRAY